MLSLLLLSFVALFSLSAKDFAVRGPQGGISFKITVPDGFYPETDKCPMVILMHGIFASKDYNPMPAIAKALALLAPGAVIKEACQGGKFFDARFNPQNPPEYVRCWGIFKLGREYLLSTQELDIYGTASAYKGKALILHGTADRTVPMWCSERYKTVYGDNAVFKIVAGENHTITRHRNEVVAEVVAFFKNELK